ncbi:MAG: hypothetical protein CMM46_09240 [Rhodospirillaceae bacterium]|nr:hypothetical protein [Rhodospirillaceae bacterium]|tara:strand:- start:1650 stop:2291 length:642 start_codon:yes stop_codon:yes gene_type:complete
MHYWDGTAEPSLSVLNGRNGNLIEVRSVIWHGIVFVDLSGEARDHNDYIAPLERCLEQYDLDDMQPDHDARGRPVTAGFDVPCNWKTFTENDCTNGLRQLTVHDIYRFSPDIPRVDGSGTKRSFDIMDKHLLGYGYRFEDMARTYPEGPLPHLWRDGAPDCGFFLNLFPNFSISVMAHSIGAWCMMPDGADMTRMVTADFFRPEATTNERFRP